MKTKIIFWLSLIVIVIISILWAVKVDSDNYHKQINQLNMMKIELQRLDNDQMNTTIKIEELKSRVTPDDSGKASYYDYQLDSGWSSEGHRVCASRVFKRGSTLEVINVYNGKKVECLVTDYGPDASQFPDRVIDLSSYAFSQISNLKQGVITVAIKKIK